ncbi:MAG: LytTR family DNA-binding domain-containing protein [bacterium]|nr:LytTR family DNA-binding domain-containing protein [bacterium]
MNVTLPFASRESTRRLRRHLVAVVLSIAFFSWLGPFGTATRLEPGVLVVYWTMAIAGNWLIALTTVPFAIRLFLQAGKPALAGIAAGSAIAALPGTGLVWILEWGLAGTTASATMLTWLYGCVVVVHLVLAFLTWRLVELPLQGREENAAPPPPARAPFLSRLPARLGEDLLHLHMQDHYVEAATPEGSELVLLRFRDALREVEILDGMQVHRSHWVARSAVSRVVRRDGRILLELSNGAKVPVSRSFQPALRAKGWL